MQASMSNFEKISRYLARLLIQRVHVSGNRAYLKPDHFMRVVAQAKDPLVIGEERMSGMLGSIHMYRYALSHKGMLFCTESSSKLKLPKKVEYIDAVKIVFPEDK